MSTGIFPDFKSGKQHLPHLALRPVQTICQPLSCFIWQTPFFIAGSGTQVQDLAKVRCAAWEPDLTGQENILIQQCHQILEILKPIIYILFWRTFILKLFFTVETLYAILLNMFGYPTIVWESQNHSPVGKYTLIILREYFLDLISV